MGTDITATIEVKRDELGWCCYAMLPYLPRWYEMFARMAGVRDGADQARFQPRGFPTDADEDTLDFLKLQCGYSASYLSADEFVPLLEGLEPDLAWDALAAYMKALAPIGPVRIVFWFDC